MNVCHFVSNVGIVMMKAAIEILELAKRIELPRGSDANVNTNPAPSGPPPVSQTKPHPQKLSPYHILREPAGTPAPPKPGRVLVCQGCGRTMDEIARKGHISRKELVRLGCNSRFACDWCSVCKRVGVPLFRGTDNASYCSDCGGAS